MIAHFSHVSKQEKVQSANSLSMDYISTFVANDFPFYFQFLSTVLYKPHNLAVSISYLQKELITLATFLPRSS